jgi:hypothetical protein
LGKHKHEKKPTSFSFLFRGVEGNSLLKKERKKERKMGEELKDKLWDDDKHSSATSIQEWMTS